MLKLKLLRILNLFYHSALAVSNYRIRLSRLPSRRYSDKISTISLENVHAVILGCTEAFKVRLLWGPSSVFQALIWLLFSLWLGLNNSHNLRFRVAPKFLFPTAHLFGLANRIKTLLPSLLRNSLSRNTKARLTYGKSSMHCLPTLIPPLHSDIWNKLSCTIN